MKKILVLYGSGRGNGNTAKLAKYALSTLPAGVAEIEEVELRKLENRFGGCCSCYGCQTGERFHCIFDDETGKLVNRLPEFDVVVFASPVYFFNLSAQTRMFIDRLMAMLRHEEDGSTSMALSPIQFAYVITSGDGEKTSGVEVARLSAKYLAEFASMPAPFFLYHGPCVDMKKELDDAKLKKQAAEFAAKLLK